MIRTRQTQDTCGRTSVKMFAAATVALATIGVCAAPASAVRFGTDAPAGAAPYAVALFTADGQQLCGGTLVAPKKVLTAAHCVSGLDDPTAITVVAGRLDLAGTGGQTRAVTKSRVHPKFEQGTLTYDAAVLDLDRPLKQQPLPIAGAKDDALYRVGNQAKVYGWGKTDGGVSTTRLKQTTLVLAPLAECAPYTFPTDSPATRVCGQAPANNPGSSICRGDSGGPLVEKGKLIGIVSTGNKYCTGEQPESVFTRASAVTKGLGL
ncbi:S1 family peptidase [Embleya sp. NPDC020886]|uniref:S1 family peptidase n=1 Tax=Embleya sp. NPDC020886 TaxID=3363980 RepID=UPI0037BD3CA0